ncbi:phospholipase D family protein [Naegleria gruberi]|uniref:Phospholipase D family protein n=1 Tax=Naegleria gruberi TaxID=5762 RepID=D2V2R3_NAEGR|nr:phospholipase D family protein [Naegleria gruberi]EFC48940.1 phospholipase D family protein [Naegleria gruberi]|eukprot:XP_002681684.1 phospholipase D family protein [Naegleria gruberi strain NEG-M]
MSESDRINNATTSSGGYHQDVYHSSPIYERGSGGGDSINDGGDDGSGFRGILKWREYNYCAYIVPAICFVLTCLVVIPSVITPALYYSYSRIGNRASDLSCESTCSYQIVESIPMGVDLKLVPNTDYTYNAWSSIISNAKSSLTIACFYSSLRNDASDVSGGQFGNQAFDSIANAIKRGIKVRIVQNIASKEFPDDDTRALEKMGAELVSIDWSKAFSGGILHTKAIAVDGQHFYVGSANLDWRSLAQVKELGVKVTNCACLTKDIEKILDIYYTLGKNMNSTFEGFRGWPENTFTSVNQFSRLLVPFENEPQKNESTVFMSASPKIINEPQRTNDIDALLAVINNSTQFVHISVMDFVPLLMYAGPQFQYWGDIENALKAAIMRNVKVKLLISKWDHTKSYQITVLQSLVEFGGKFCTESHKCTGSISAKIFQLPDQQDAPKYPFTRVNHAKYMVTEKQAYISTSNWSKDYFYTTAGISFVSTTPSLRQTVNSIFERDYSSIYAFDLPPVNTTKLYESY